MRESAKSKRGPRSSALKEAQYEMMHGVEAKARRSIEEDELDSRESWTGSVIMKVGIGVGLVIWMLAMLWIARGALTRKDPDGGPNFRDGAEVVPPAGKTK